MKELKELYIKTFGVEPIRVETIAQAGSNRTYVRFFSSEGIEPQTSIGVIGQDKDENNAFIYLTQHFTRRKLPVPKILAVAEDGMRYLQSDLGDKSLYVALEKGRKAQGRYNVEERKLLRRTIALLPELQVRGARELDFTQCYPQAEFDKTGVLFDLNYFKYCFLKATDIDYHELKLEADFQLLAKDLTADVCENFLYRDFQARNIMLSADGQPYFIDYQGGRRGPLPYDLVSFLWQASAHYPPELRKELINVYIENLKQYTEVNEVTFRKSLTLFVLFRLLQVLGTYGFRGLFEHKPYFIDSIPPAMDNIRQLLEEGGCPYPYLRSVLIRLTELPQFQKVIFQSVREDGYKTTDTNIYKAHSADGPATYSKYDGKGQLVVRIFSFSFRKGLPVDESGNGGGYVFDCRSTHNPGRYEPYKQLTGLDEPVIRFLEDDGEILTFLDKIYPLADAHVQRYLQRGFTDLMFSFGCTGGQHRSVYSAQHLAEHLHQKFGIEVHILHREQQIEQTL
ncbi:MAG: RNase adapter RapZ, partial [Bacteroidaceae bacterium]